ncbi:hypothetical protein BD410DRAFT_843715 [Rickenella mellea]|uniref:Uncharacterized protein n=1 Tax=Rickenella mellea TaxID=50990 RepID=A0A4Y7PQX7_9AGAM|nr:hypothetical protein BD410DRAFT_843715 [Rickenella mellea]
MLDKTGEEPLQEHLDEVDALEAKWTKPQEFLVVPEDKDDEKMTKEAFDAKWKIKRSREEVISGWFYRRNTKITKKGRVDPWKPIMESFFKSTGKCPARQAPWVVYGRIYYEDHVKATYEERWKASNQPKNMSLKMRNECIKEAFDKESPELKEEIETLAREENEAARRKHKQLSEVSDDPEIQEELIRRMPAIVKPLLEVISEHMGLKVLLLAGKAKGNNKFVFTGAHVGETIGTKNLNWDKHDPEGWTQMAKCFAGFLNHTIGMLLPSMLASILLNELSLVLEEEDEDEDEDEEADETGDGGGSLNMEDGDANEGTSREKKARNRKSRAKEKAKEKGKASGASRRKATIASSSGSHQPGRQSTRANPSASLPTPLASTSTTPNSSTPTITTSTGGIAVTANVTPPPPDTEPVAAYVGGHGAAGTSATAPSSTISISANSQFTRDNAEHPTNNGNKISGVSGECESGSGADETGDGADKTGDSAEETGDSAEELGDGTERLEDGAEELEDGAEESGDKVVVEKWLADLQAKLPTGNAWGWLRMHFKCLAAMNYSAEWVATVRAWAEMEQLGDGNGSKPLPATHRPERVPWWTKRHQPAKSPQILNIPEYVEMWNKWWTVLSKDLQKSFQLGKKGFLNVLVTLKWWRDSVKGDDLAGWNDAVAKVKGFMELLRDDNRTKCAKCAGPALDYDVNGSPLKKRQKRK